MHLWVPMIRRCRSNTLPNTPRGRKWPLCGLLAFPLGPRNSCREWRRGRGSWLHRALPPAAAAGAVDGVVPPPIVGRLVRRRVRLEFQFL